MFLSSTSDHIRYEKINYHFQNGPSPSSLPIKKFYDAVIDLESHTRLKVQISLSTWHLPSPTIQFCLSSLLKDYNLQYFTPQH